MYKKQILFEGKKIAGYILGFVLFFAPFAFFQTVIGYFLGYKDYAPSIHNLCLRIPIEHLLSGKFFTMSGPAFIGTVLLLGTALVFGPLFCGVLCPAGAMPEYLSRLVPGRFQVDWPRHLPVTALRYGFLFGFLLAPFSSGLIACAYCNFYVFDLLINFTAWGYIVSYTSSMLLTLLLWLVLLGLFTRGGRGFCLFFCPIGSAQSFVHYLGSKLPFSWQLKINKTACVKCGKCIESCPMRALSCEGEIRHNRHICILCMRCSNNCASGGITYTSNLEGGGI